MNRYKINRIMPRHRHKYTKYKTCLPITMVTPIKQRVTNTLSSIHEKVKQC